MSLENRPWKKKKKKKHGIGVPAAKGKWLSPFAKKKLGVTKGNTKGKFPCYGKEKETNWEGAALLKRISY